MPGLLDIAAATKQVAVRGQQIDVHGISAKGIAHLLARFPELRKILAGLEVDFESLLKMGGDVVAGVIAAGCGYPGDSEAEKTAESLALEEQADLIIAILELTLPNGMGPFIEKITAMGGHMDIGELPQKAPGTKLPSPSKP